MEYKRIKDQVSNKIINLQDIDSQDQDTYVTNLLSQDPQIAPTYGGQSGTSLVTLDDSPSLPLKNSTRSRGLNFSLEEDKLLASAWLNCSLDACQGMDQKHYQLWEKISEYFQQHKETTTERTIKSLINRWSFIQKATSKFCSKLAEVEGLNQNGMTEQDKLDKAKIMYQSSEKCNFQFEHCWQLLKDQPKWISRDVIKQRKSMFSSPTPIQTRFSGPVDDSVCDVETGNVIENGVIELDRPMSGEAEAEEEKRKAQDGQADETIQLKKTKHTIFEDSRAQEKEFYRLMIEKMEHDKEKEEKKLHLEDEKLKLKTNKLRVEVEKEQRKMRQEDERLRLEAEKLELAKKESDHRIMMMDVSVMSEMQRLYFEGLQKEIMARRIHARDDQL